jgi:hypothetical protein
LVNGALNVAVTTLPASLIEVRLDIWLGKLIEDTLLKLVGAVDWNAGEKAKTPSTPPKTLPALATNNLELLGRTAAWVGFWPVPWGAAGPLMGVSAAIVSPETSICVAQPGKPEALALMLKTSWKPAGDGAGSGGHPGTPPEEQGMTTGR